MALVFGPWSIDFRYKDADENSSTFTMYMQEAAAFADVETFAGLVRAAVEPLTDAVLTGYSITRNVFEDAPADAPETSDVERKGYFLARLSDTRSTSISIPSIENSLVVNGTNVINRAAAQVVAFVDLWQASGVDRVGTDLIRVEKAEKRHRGSTNG
jgi:hypothetical protein